MKQDVSLLSIGTAMKESQPEDDALGSEAIDKHRIPAIDRMMDVLGLLERRSDEARIRDLVALLGLPRTTVYRILNSLQSHEMVRRSPSGGYTLGPRLITLASRVLASSQDYDLAQLSLPHLEQLTAEVGEASKVSVRDRDGVLVVAAVKGTQPYALTSSPGQRLPLHAGAAGKVLLAYLPPAELKPLIEGPLSRFTDRTLTDPDKLTQELARIRSRGWSLDRGEYALSVNAVAAPIPDRTGKVIAALSIPFVAGADRERIDRLRVAAVAVAGAIAADLPSQHAPLDPATAHSVLVKRAAQSKNARSSSER
jgi:DNA-binding IclR family transcriptional regulator